MMFFPGKRSGAPSSVVPEMMSIVENTLKEGGMETLLWRKVPIGEYALGNSALESLPDIRQVVIRRPFALSIVAKNAAAQESSDNAFERSLYLARKRLEKRLSAVAGGKYPFYIPSMSHRTLVYKGLVVAPNLRKLYPDLNDSDFQSSIALFHQRYSTNTFPMWYTAQPFRMLAHNGEINTLPGNLNWMKMREETMSSPLYGKHFRDLLPVVQEGGSDSANLDNVLELLVQCGRSPLQAIAMLVPEAYENNKVLDSKLRSFYEYQRTLMEPWDGPAALCFTDGRIAAAQMDRNGLRPLRYWITESQKVIAASEVGVVDIPNERILERGRLGPGDMFCVDTERGLVLKNEQIKDELSSFRPYQAWLERSINHVSAGRSGLGQMISYRSIMDVLQPLEALNAAGEAPVPPALKAAADLRVRQKKAFGYSKEDEELIFKPMIDTAHEPIGSMGDDTPIAAFSSKPQLIYRYFKQRFAEVTNPPIDPLLERHVMSLEITFGRKGALLQEDQHASFLIRMPSPIATEAQLKWLLNHPEFKSRTVNALWQAKDGPGGLKTGIEELCRKAEEAVDAGVSYLLLSDRGVSAEHAPIPMLMAVGAVHHHLISKSKRMRASILVETGEAREDHHVACLISYGASVVYPYMAYEIAAELAVQRSNAASAAALEESEDSVASKDEKPASIEEALYNYRKALQDGLLRIMSKMGISTVDSYRGAQQMESLGLADDVIRTCFVGTTNRIPTVSLEAIGRDVLAFHSSGFDEPIEFKRGSALPRTGAYAYVKNGEFHAFNPLVFNKLRKAADSPDFKTFEAFSKEVDFRPLTSLRDALDYKKAPSPIPLNEVESVESLVKRFSTQAMSHGSISRETHEVLSIAANRLGSRSNTGEGGEDPGRYVVYTEDRKDLSLSDHWWPKKGDNGNSKIKQVASARFGVTPAYLINAEQLEIKMAQGSKPGEGGHIPGHKVNGEIARNRYSVPNVTLISPPPHHDIYSIEDLAQLIYDLKRVNKDAQVCVKLVSEAGVGTIAAGVVKAYADYLQISGNDGGTGASPLASIKNAGLPWELGLAEAQQVLVLNDLRSRVVIRVDGGFKDGRDVVMGALLGAEEFGFGTAALVALGCVMARKCHLNTCPVGIATQDPELRKKFKGKPEQVTTFLIHTAEQTRRIMAEMGIRTVDELVGRTDLLTLREKAVFPKGPADMSALLYDADPSRTKARKASSRKVRSDPDALRASSSGETGTDLDETLWRTLGPFLDQIAAKIASGQTLQPVGDEDDSITLHFPIGNAARSVGVRVSGELARRCGNAGLPGDGRITLRFHGVAGQSFGAFLSKGMKLVLRGEAHDYVGKGMHGGMIAMSFQSKAQISASSAISESDKKDGLLSYAEPHHREHVICGNAVMFGATGGKLFGAGRGGERFAVRNSGGIACIEGVGDNACEYMTNGTVVVLGRTGRNFGAGMSGGEAYVLDVADTFLDRLNPGMCEALKVKIGTKEEIKLRSIIEEHVKETGSAYGAHLLAHWRDAIDLFWHVSPNTTPLKERSQALVHVPNWSARRLAQLEQQKKDLLEQSNNVQTLLTGSNKEIDHERV
jgi:glutamate synthase (ferredoxin)